MLCHRSMASASRKRPASTIHSGPGLLSSPLCHPLFKMLANHCSMIDGSISEISPADERNQDPLTSLPQRAMGKRASERVFHLREGQTRREDGRRDGRRRGKEDRRRRRSRRGREALNPGNTHVVRPANQPSHTGCECEPHGKDCKEAGRQTTS